MALQYILTILCLKISWRLGYFWSYFCHRPNSFLMTKKLRQFVHNIRKYTPLSSVTATFNTNVIQITKMSQQKKQAGGYINSLNMCPCPINLYPWFLALSAQRQRWFKLGVWNTWWFDNQICGMIHSIASLKRIFYLLIMLKQKQNC